MLSRLNFDAVMVRSDSRDMAFRTLGWMAQITFWNGWVVVRSEDIWYLGWRRDRSAFGIPSAVQERGKHDCFKIVICSVSQYLVWT